MNFKDNKNFKVFLFVFGCLGTRFLFMYLSKISKPKNLPIYGVIGLLIGLGLIYNFLFKTRPTGLESSAKDNKIWWNNLRPIHGTLYLLFAYYAINKNKNAYIFLLIDLIVAIIAYICYKLNML
jgi:hypothetical protein